MTDSGKALQAVLFVRGERVHWKELGRVLALSQEELRQAAAELMEDLSGSGLTVVMSQEGVELVTSGEVARLVAALEEGEAEELTKAAAETLAIVAYRGPLSRQEVSALRGVESGPMLRQLQRRSLIERLKGEAGVMLYDLSGEALKQLGVGRRSELPDFELLSSDEKVQAFLQEERR